jgi:transposase
MDAKLFNAYIEKRLLPELEVGSIIMMDNASYHKSKKTRELIEENGCKVMYLPQGGNGIKLREFRKRFCIVV